MSRRRRMGVCVDGNAWFAACEALARGEEWSYEPEPEIDLQEALAYQMGGWKSDVDPSFWTDQKLSKDLL